MIESKIIDLQKEKKKKEKKQELYEKKLAFKKIKQDERRKKERKRNFIILTVLFVLIFGYSIYTILGLLFERNQLNKENEKLKIEKKNLEEDIKAIDSPEYIEKKAREDLKLVLPGEIIYVDKKDDSNEPN